MRIIIGSNVFFRKSVMEIWPKNLDIISEEEYEKSRFIGASNN